MSTESRAGKLLANVDEPVCLDSIEVYDMSEMANLSPKRTGIDGVVIYAGRADDRGKHSPYRIKVSVGKAWGASDKAFSMGIKGSTKGKWFRVKGSFYKAESDVPAKYLKAARLFIDRNEQLLIDWVDYDGLEDDSERFVPRVKSVKD
tara:strand:+ start:97831 stop:98274 length:444 start_codon:yes stop_codon:yes gene_type:complete